MSADRESELNAARDARGRKAALRRRLRGARRALEPEVRARKAAQLAGHAATLPRWRAGARLAAYVAADGEMDPAPLLASAAAAGLALYLPRIDQAGALSFHPWKPGASLQLNRYGIGEPAPGTALPAAELDLLCLPLVAFAGDGTRLGMGAGYYDRTLAAKRPGLLVGLSYDSQEVATLPRDSWDVPLDGVLTETGWRPFPDAS